jgi:hypothetical protein
MIMRVAGLSPEMPRLLALSDLHVAYPESREIVANLRPERAGDWLRNPFIKRVPAHVPLIRIRRSGYSH